MKTVKKLTARYLIGIDEAGRGPIAGPVSVGAVLIYEPARIREFHGVRDSKELSAAAREVWHERIVAAQAAGTLRVAVSLVSAQQIDRVGITRAIRQALRACLHKLDINPSEVHILLDGGLYAPQTFPHQTTIIRGDKLEPIISLASIMAKVTRDRKMVAMAKKYKNYGFEHHKGYGTKAHYAAVQKHGICPIHRRYFLRNVMIK